MRTTNRSAWMARVSGLVTVGCFLLLVALCACGNQTTTTPTEGPLVRLHVTPLASGTTQAVLTVTATDAASMNKTAKNTFAEAPLDLLGVSFPPGTRSSATFVVELFGNAGCLLGTGTAMLNIDSDGVFDVTVNITSVPLCGNGVTLTVQVANIQLGKGTVTSSPSGISCDATGKGCTLTLMKNTPVTLTANNTGGNMSAFNGWSGGGCSGTNPCTVPMDRDTSVQAVFTSCHGWCKETLPGVVLANLNGIGGTLSSNVVVVGDGGAALRWDGGTWIDLSNQTGGVNLRGVGANSTAGMLYVVGDNGSLYRMVLGTLSKLPTATTSTLRSIAIANGASPSAYAVGDAGVSQVITSTGTAATASTLKAGTIASNSICQLPGSAASDFYVGGAASGGRGWAAFWDGAGTTTLQMVSGPSIAGNIYSIGCATSYVYATGDGGAIVRRSLAKMQENNWMAVGTGVTTSALRGIWVAADNFMIAVGDGGTILQSDGSTWTKMSSGVLTNLRAVWGTGPTNIYAVGDAGTVLRYTP